MLIVPIKQQLLDRNEELWWLTVIGKMDEKEVIGGVVPRVHGEKASVERARALIGQGMERVESYVREQS